MDIPALLDAAKEAQGFKTDMALAKALNISRSAVSAWRNGIKTPDTVQCAALAGYTGLPLARVLGIVGEARAISREEKAVWRHLATTAGLLFVLMMPWAQQAKGADISGGYEPSIPKLHIMSTVAALRLWALTLLAWLLHYQRDRLRKPSPEVLQA